MSYKAKTIQQKINSPKKAVNNNQKRALTIDDQIDKQAPFLTHIEGIQQGIDNYNHTLITDYTKLMSPERKAVLDKINLTGRNVLVMLCKENYVKQKYTIGDKKVYDAGFRQILANKTAYEHQAEFVDNPFPYIFTGVVVKTSSSSKENMPELQEGSVVFTTAFNMKDRRFYINKQRVDIINSPANGWTVDNFEGYFLIDYTTIDAILSGVTPTDEIFASPLDNAITPPIDILENAE
jgi:hypothetical protein